MHGVQGAAVRRRISKYQGTSGPQSHYMSGRSHSLVNTEMPSISVGCERAPFQNKGSYRLYVERADVC